MRMIRDTTRRFSARPYYEGTELDTECERIVTAFLRERGRLAWPVSTDDLTKLLEQNVSDLDLYADLSDLGNNFEGVTDFSPGQLPRVRICRDLASSAKHENRLRTTITHELGHVKLHNFLFQLAAENVDLFLPTSTRNEATKRDSRATQRCMRGTIIDSHERDWMEWQAGYACGAFLMPRSFVTQDVADFRRKHHLLGDIEITSDLGSSLISLVSERYAVSTDAARVRLAKLNVLIRKAANSIF